METKMPNPAPRSCEVSGCEYKTPTGLTSHEQQFQDIRLHLVMAHPQIATTWQRVVALNPVSKQRSWQDHSWRMKYQRLRTT